MATLDQIKTIVLVMMENRSFDHMLGHLSLSQPGLDVEGLRSPLDQYANIYNGSLYPLYNLAHDVELESDVPHEYCDVDKQLKKNPVNNQYTMKGFVEAYAKKSGTVVNAECLPMGYFKAQQVPVTDFLSRNFCTCDRWFTPIPTSTQPNRTMAFCGYSSIYQTHTQLIPITENLFKWMDDHGVRWRVYHDGFSFFALYNALWPYVLGSGFRRYEYLYNDLLNEPAGHSPEVIIIEPNYHDAPHFGSKHPNDNHAPLAVGWGEDFLRRTYQAVTANKEKWQNTLMIVYYDEHGGFFDHVPPPPISYTTTGTPSKTFESMGPRIPGILVSPFVSPGSFCHELFDHTSVLQLLAEKFTPGQIYSTSVDQRKNAGVKSLSVAFNQNMIPNPPTPPAVSIHVETALGKTLSVTAKSPMEQSFQNAALQMMEQKPAETAQKYPELTAWKGTLAEEPNHA